jgi:hypothetical protein
MNCTQRYKSKATQAEVEKVFKLWSKQVIQRYGGLPPNAWIDFKKGFKRGFMRSCKLRNKTNSVKSKSKSKK